MGTNPAFPPERAQEARPLTLHLAGDLDYASLPQLKKQLHQAIRIEPPGVVIVDMSGVTFIDCSSLGPLVAAHACLGSRLTLRAAAPPVARLLEVTDLYERLVGQSPP